MAKNKKKGAKKQQNSATAAPSSQAADINEQPHEKEQPVELQNDQQLENLSGDMDKQNGTTAEPLKVNNEANEQIEKLQEEIRTLKSQLEIQKKEQEVQKEVPQQETPDVTETQAYKDLKSERDEYENQYNNLLNRISSMKTVFSKMKESQEELETVKEQLSEYESQNIRLKSKADLLSKERTEFEKTILTLNEEFSNLDEERENLQIECKKYKEELDKLTNQLEEASDNHLRELNIHREANAQLEAQLQELVVTLGNNKQDLSILNEEKKDLISTLESNAIEKDSLQKTINELEAELEKATAQFEEEKQQKHMEINALRAQLDKSEDSNSELTKTIEQHKEEIQSMREDVDMKKRLEQECKERVLQIGKLRHEAIILNEHLTKALTMLKQSSDSESVDKELISNLLISFVAIPRADPRKFEVLDLISSFLNWDDDKKRQAGLLHNNERISRSAGSRSSTENFVSLWTDFLEKESEK
ncbi:Rud3p TDEL_0A05820 [Torulaspora delbrueckii]|uniref:GRIP domain-containing protein n=1 Tax=Torulaspora delbrueckii TaxID=4950 RepID=G8ZMS0_TORDE|nr:hypothetical protein TDEL_0A05820 [Torulaspora delbrueckii]CCE89914.1 hypothetical protein TDEL_0A05820 [Torulaspora delbrueckii]